MAIRRKHSLVLTVSYTPCCTTPALLIVTIVSRDFSLKAFQVVVRKPKAPRIAADTIADDARQQQILLKMSI